MFPCISTIADSNLIMDNGHFWSLDKENFLWTVLSTAPNPTLSNAHLMSRNVPREVRMALSILCRAEWGGGGGGLAEHLAASC